MTGRTSFQEARAEEAGGSSDRVFGLFFAAVFLLLALAPLRSHGRLRLWCLPVSALFLAPALLRPALLAPLNRLWTRIGVLLNRVVNPIVLCAIFLLAVTPLALLLRLFGKRPLQLEFDPHAESYWSQRPDHETGNMNNQF